MLPTGGAGAHGRSRPADMPGGAGSGNLRWRNLRDVAWLRRRLAHRVDRVSQSLDPLVPPLLRGWLHAVTFPLAVAAGVVLIVLARGTTARVAVSVYAASAALLFGVSALYHRGRWTGRARQVLKRLDHANIYLIIAGSYTPFAALLLDGTMRVVVLAAMWGGALLGVLFRTLWVEAPRWLYTPLYVALGWAAAFFLGDLLHRGGVTVLVLLVVGGFLYTVGGLVYGLRRPDPFPRHFGFHEVFHALTVAAFTTQYVAVSLVAYRA